MTASYARGLHELGNSLYAYLQPDGGWGQSNAGLVCDGKDSLLIDTLFDLQLTERMLSEMRRAAPAAGRIDTLVNTHANGDHCYGNQLVKDARIVASGRTATEMTELPPAAFASLVTQAPNLGEGGEFFLRCFGAFDFEGIELVLPTETFDSELTISVGAKEVTLIEVGPAHTRGDTLAYLAAERVLFTGDILFHGAHPIAWAGPVGNWISACNRILSMDVEVIVPGHGPRAAGRVGRGARVQGLLRVPLRAGPELPRAGDDPGAGRPLDWPRPLGAVGRSRAAGGQHRDHLPRAVPGARAAQHAARLSADGRAGARPAIGPFPSSATWRRSVKRHLAPFRQAPAGADEVLVGVPSSTSVPNGSRR